MGLTPTPIVSPAPTRESLHLAMARHHYVLGSLSIEEYEESVEHVLRGGYLTAEGRIPNNGEVDPLSSPFPKPRMERSMK